MMNQSYSTPFIAMSILRHTFAALSTTLLMLMTTVVSYAAYNPDTSNAIGITIAVADTSPLQTVQFKLQDNYACPTEKFELVIAAASTSLFDDEDQIISRSPIQFTQKIAEFGILNEYLASSYVLATCAALNNDKPVKLELISPEAACEMEDGQRNARRSVTSSGRSSSHDKCAE